MATQYEGLGPQDVTSVNFSDNLLAGDFPREEEGCTIQTGHAAMTRGTILETGAVAGQVKAYDGTGTIVGVLAVATPITTGEYKAFMYTTGEFNEALMVGLTLGNEATNRAALRAMNIYPKPVSTV